MQNLTAIVFLSAVPGMVLIIILAYWPYRKLRLCIILLAILTTLSACLPIYEDAWGRGSYESCRRNLDEKNTTNARNSRRVSGYDTLEQNEHDTCMRQVQIMLADKVHLRKHPEWPGVWTLEDSAHYDNGCAEAWGLCYLRRY